MQDKSEDSKQDIYSVSRAIAEAHVFIIEGEYNDDIPIFSALASANNPVIRIPCIVDKPPMNSADFQRYLHEVVVRR